MGIVNNILRLEYSQHCLMRPIKIIGAFNMGVNGVCSEQIVKVSGLVELTDADCKIIL